MTPTENVKCPNCTDGVRSKGVVTMKCGTCWGAGFMTQAELDRALMLRVRR